MSLSVSWQPKEKSDYKQPVLYSTRTQGGRTEVGKQADTEFIMEMEPGEFAER